MKAFPVTVLCLFLLAAASRHDGVVSAAATDTRVTPGELVVDPPTLINLGFEWLIDGDANRNASVEVSYRRQGEATWQRGMPLLRLQGETIYQPNSWNLVTPNMFAGSILDLQPDTAYEARFVLTDPDGNAGRAADATRTVTVRTRPEPVPYAGGTVYHVYPPRYAGTKLEPSFDGIMCAYYYVCGGGDTTTTARPRVKPGDTILVHAGTYAYRPEFYGPDRTVNVTSPYEGTYYLTASGTPERPIAIKGAGDGDVIIDGRGNFALFNVQAAHYNYFEGLTFRNTDIAIWAGRQFIAGAKGLTVKRCRFEDVGMGVFSNFSGSSNFYIADSSFFGRDDSTRLLGWNGDFWRQVANASGQAFPPTMASYVAVKLYGPGHVVAHNYIANFHDGIDVETYGNPDGSSAIDGPAYPAREFWDRRPVAIDFYNNYLTNFHDNAIEIDGSLHNIRVMRNVMINSASHPMCNQPAGGGPVYWIRNIIYHAPGGSTRMTSGAAGVLFYNNTVLSETSAGSSANVHWRNNLLLGENSSPAIFSVATNTNYSSSDYNGFRPNPGAVQAFQWTSPRWGVAADYGLGGADAATAQASGGSEAGAANRALEARRFPGLAEYVAATRQDQHSLLVDYDVFVNVPRLDAKDVQAVQRLYRAEDLDFRLKPGSAAVDRGIVIPNVTDGFSGRGPDLGALEVDGAPPVYGPRLVAATAVAQAAPAPDPLVKENATVKLAAHTYVIPDGSVPLVPNVGIVIGSRATLVIDPGLGRRNGEAVLREVARISKNSEIFVGTTHFHAEHTTGYLAFPPTAKYVNSTIQETEFAESGAQLIQTFARRSPLTAELLKDATRRNADVTFDREYVLDLGGVRVRFLVVGPTHTRGDTAFFVEGDGVLFAGDVVMNNSFLAATPVSSMKAWLAAFDAFDALHPGTIVPSHGPVGTGALVASNRAVMEGVQSRARELKTQGRSADDTAATVQAEFQARNPQWPRAGGLAAAARAAYVEAP